MSVVGDDQVRVPKIVRRPAFEDLFWPGHRTCRSAQKPDGMSLILPLPFLDEFKDSIRLTGFFDAGNVYGPDEDIEFDEIRYSTGIGGIWISPFGAVSISFAVPLNEKDTDRIEQFQFTFGTSF